MKVIYAGFSKCGTKSIAHALRDLGLTVYDVLENFEFLGDKWLHILEEGGTKEDFYEMYKDVDAVTDVPCYYFWNQILEAFPDAKIIFSQRSTEDEWWESIENQKAEMDGIVSRILPLLSPTNAKLYQFRHAIVKAMFGHDQRVGIFRKEKSNEMLARHTYRSHNSYVLNCAPKDQLLVFDFSKGWAPLCQFLDLPIPDTPFPHKNKKGSITQELMDTHPLFARIKREVCCSGSLLVCLTAYLSYQLYTNSGVIWESLTSSLREGFNFIWETSASYYP